MSDRMFGADVEALRLLGEVFDDASQQLDTARQQIEAAVSAADWWGPSGEQFRGEWADDHAPRLATVSAGLTEAGAAARRNADAQDTTSSTLDGVGPGGAGGPGGPGRPGGDAGGDYATPDNDKPDPGDMGDYGGERPATGVTLTDISADEIAQGQIGDCWFLAALGGVANDDPDFIRNHMVQNPDGTWTVTMYDDGEPVKITVEPTVPEGSVSEPGTRDPNWASIYEKAAAEYYGGEYADLEGGKSIDAYEAITGKEADSHGEASISEIEDLLADGPVALSTEDDDSYWWWEDEVDDNRIVPNHAYIVEGVTENANGEKVIQIRNPWGPSGGNLDGQFKDGYLEITEEQYRENFDDVYAVDSTKGN